MTTLQRYRTYRKISSGKATAVLLVAAFLAVLVPILVCKACRAASEQGEQEDRYDSIIQKAGRRNGVNPDLVKAVIWRESNFDRKTVGGQGEIGLMQIMRDRAVTDWAREKKRDVPSKAQLFDPELNIEIGSWYLGRAVKRWAKYREHNALALCEYNAGRTRANAWKPENPNGSVLERIKIDSTKKYVGDILRKYEEYRRKSSVTK